MSVKLLEVDGRTDTESLKVMKEFNEFDILLISEITNTIQMRRAKANFSGYFRMKDLTF